MLFFLLKLRANKDLNVLVWFLLELALSLRFEGFLRFKVSFVLLMLVLRAIPIVCISERGRISPCNVDFG